MFWRNFEVICNTGESLEGRDSAYLRHHEARDSTYLRLPEARDSTYVRHH
jgi:hypothetical protein